MSEHGREPDAERDAGTEGETGTGTDDAVPDSPTTPDADPAADTGDDSEAEHGSGPDGEGESESTDETEREDDGPVAVGDRRQKYVEVLTRSGERTEHVKVYLRHTTDEFVVSSDDDFPAAETTRYPKADLLRVEVAQQHSTCFITTAVADESETLGVLRGFRDDVLRRTQVGKALVGLYERVSPPVACTLSRHPTARTTELVRWLVTRSGTLERRRRRARSRPYRGVLALALVGFYLVGVWCALCGHVVIGLRESFDGPVSAGTRPATNGTDPNTDTRP